MKKLFLVIGLFVLSACSGGGGGGSSPSTSIPQIIAPPKMSCGGIDCISGSTISSSSFSAKSIDAFAVNRFIDFKSSYDSMKSYLWQVENYINSLNVIADEEGIESCNDIPTSGSITSVGSTLTFSTSSESWNIGNGMVAMDKKIFMSDATTDAEIHLKCDTSVQSLHIIWKNSNDRFEAFSQINTITKAISIQSAYISGSTGNRSMGYFNTDGTDFFELAHFSSGSSSQTSVIGKSFKNSTYNNTSIDMEYAISDVLGADLDSVDFGDNGTSERGCASSYRSSSPNLTEYSCDPDGDPMNPVKDALLTSNGILLGNSGSPAWDTTYLNSLTIADPQ